MGDQAAAPALEVFGKGRRRDSRGRAREHRLGVRLDVEPSEGRGLGGHRFGDAFLNVGRAVERLGPFGQSRDARAHLARRGAVKEIEPFQFGQVPFDGAERLGHHAGRDRKAGSRNRRGQS